MTFQFLKFGLVGASGYLLDIGVFALALALGTGQLIAAAVAFLAAGVSNFWCNRHWTFSAADGERSRQATRFALVSVGAFLFAAAVMQLLVTEGGVPVLEAQAASVFAAAPLGFIGNRVWTFDDARPAHAGPLRLAGGAERPHTWVVVPTYNEAENLERFVRALLPPLASAAGEHRVLIVDDSSPDGTGQVADRLAAEVGAVEVLHRTEKDGLGRAYAAGFRRALDAGADLVVQMDADLSHDPDAVPDLIAGARSADLVLGSRYVAGGTVADWGLGRRLLSRGGSWYARTVLGVRVGDLTGGFKCFRRDVLEWLAQTGFQSAGFGFQVEVTYRALQAGASVKEVPIVFRDRRAGTSKMSARIVAEALWRVFELRLRHGRSVTLVPELASPARHELPFREMTRDVASPVVVPSG